MELSSIIPHIEALIFASDKPLTSPEIVELINNAFGFMEERISKEQVDSCLDGIKEKYNSEFYPFEVRESGGGFQFLTKREFHKTIVQLNGEKFLKRLSNAALETLAIIAYKQPITKGEIESIRGVNSDYSIQKLLEKELIVITGRNEELPGKPLIYSTSKTFMDYFGINSPADLPKIKEVMGEQKIEPTVMNPKEFMSEQASLVQGEGLFVVNDKGELLHQQPTATEGEENTREEQTTEVADEVAPHAEEPNKEEEPSNEQEPRNDADDAEESNEEPKQ